MRVVLICPTFSPSMGYLTAVLPKYLARLGADVHVVSLDQAAYEGDAAWAGAMPSFYADQVLPLGETKLADGYRVHILRRRLIGGYAFARGLGSVLSRLRPEIVYSATSIGALPLQAALISLRLPYKLFTGNHTSSSTFSLARTTARSRFLAYLSCMFMRWLPGRLVSMLTVKCYCRTRDCADIARRFFGVQQSKLSVLPLGVDSDHFFPVSTAGDIAQREALRSNLQIDSSEILCIYTGRLIASKNIALLAQAVERLRGQGLRYRALFIGGGPERDQLKAYANSIVLDFMPFNQLGRYYRAADIAAWPGGIESTSIYDAAACGLPIVCNEKIGTEHLFDNGLMCTPNDLDSLCVQLTALGDPRLRRGLGSRGAEKALRELGWDRIARIRMGDFETALPRSVSRDHLASPSASDS